MCAVTAAPCSSSFRRVCSCSFLLPCLGSKVCDRHDDPSAVNVHWQEPAVRQRHPAVGHFLPAELVTPVDAVVRVQVLQVPGSTQPDAVSLHLSPRSQDVVAGSLARPRARPSLSPSWCGCFSVFKLVHLPLPCFFCFTRFRRVVIIAYPMASASGIGDDPHGVG